MTVCIAAACKVGAEHKIVLCTDRKSSSMLGSAETARKAIRLGNGWRCLTAGVESDILSLVRLYSIAFKDINNLAPEKIDETIKGVLHQGKKRIGGRIHTKKVFEKTLYNVFEAKRLSESVGSIGKQTYMSVLSQGDDNRLTSVQLDYQLQAWFKKYGPQKVPDEGNFDGDYYFKRDEDQ